jgi:hypothetical protein
MKRRMNKKNKHAWTRARLFVLDMKARRAKRGKEKGESRHEGEGRKKEKKEKSLSTSTCFSPSLSPSLPSLSFAMATEIAVKLKAGEAYNVIDLAKLLANQHPTYLVATEEHVSDEGEPSLSTRCFSNAAAAYAYIVEFESEVYERSQEDVEFHYDAATKTFEGGWYHQSGRTPCHSSVTVRNVTRVHAKNILAAMKKVYEQRSRKEEGDSEEDDEESEEEDE